MTFVYDIYVNFQTIYYDFYEWNKKDKIMHIKKIPIFEVKNDIFQKMIIHENKIDETSFELIKNKTEIFKKKRKISAVLFTNNQDIIAVLLNSSGKIIKKSCLLVEDESMILRNVHKIDFLPLTLIELGKNEPILATRTEIERKKFLLENFSQMKENEIIYLYFECFGEVKKEKGEMEKELKREINSNNEKISTISYNFLKLIGTIS